MKLRKTEIKYNMDKINHTYYGFSALLPASAGVIQKCNKEWIFSRIGGGNQRKQKKFSKNA